MALAEDGRLRLSRAGGLERLDVGRVAVDHREPGRGGIADAGPGGKWFPESR